MKNRVGSWTMSAVFVVRSVVGTESSTCSDENCDVITVFIRPDSSAHS